MNQNNKASHDMNVESSQPETNSSRPSSTGQRQIKPMNDYCMLSFKKVNVSDLEIHSSMKVDKAKRVSFN
jgi:hypothetical protein